LIDQLQTSAKYGLALHTTTPELGLAMSKCQEETRSAPRPRVPASPRHSVDGEIRCDVWNLERRVSSLLHQYLIEFIKPQTWADLAFIAVAKGPGGFTGTRIGVVTARTLGQQLDIPVFAMSTLAAVVWSEKPKRSIEQDVVTTTIAVQMPAQRGQVFAAIYQFTPDYSGLNILLPDTVLTPEIWQNKLANWHTEYDLIEAKSGLAATVNSILELAYLDWCAGKRPHWLEASPYYGQHPVNI